MPQEDEKSRSQLAFADGLAEVFARQVPRMAGRMLGLLLITDEPRLSSKDLVDQLGASAATVSNMGRLLIGLGLVERTVSPETRRDLFAIAPNAWVGTYRDGERYITEVLALADRVLADPDLTDIPRARLRELRNLYTFVWAEIPDLVSRYEQWREANGPEALYQPPGRSST
ncbi:MarR family transcriptional regulator [Sphaerisporangium sp. NPDC051011]|uniref:GbsR/MarR family transcriptional regulator n=1 Tax=Sphaerisporangium sp. NPDC051011 TaxID=3155792 RepID=UPI0033F630CD